MPPSDQTGDPPESTASDATPVVFRPPRIDDGAAMWQLTAETGVLDVNSSYAYLLWCRDFAATSVVAIRDGVVGFVTGYRRPDAPETLMVWQVAVASHARGMGVAGGMLDHLVARESTGAEPYLALETTISDDNAASRALFGAFAERHGATVERTVLFDHDVFPIGTDGAVTDHEPEVLHRIEPLLS